MRPDRTTAMTTVFTQNYIEDLPVEIQFQIMNTVKSSVEKDRLECNRIREKFLFPEQNGRHSLLHDLMDITCEVDCHLNHLSNYDLNLVLNEQIYNTYVEIAIDDVVNELSEREPEYLVYTPDDYYANNDRYLYPLYRDDRHGYGGFGLTPLRDYCASINKPDAYRKMLSIDEQYDESMKLMLREAYTITLQEAILINKYDLIYNQDIEE